ncbi:TPA: hypothetical protein ACGXNJ_005272 [Bacillus cereus]
MKIVKSILNALNKRAEKAGEKNLKKVTATIRYDIVKRAIERGEFKRIECAYSYTDDYLYDNATNFGKGAVSAERMLREFRTLTPSCWVRIKEKDGKEYYEISISFHSNLAYDMIVPMN